MNGKKGKENLISLADRTMEERREIARKAGKASGKARREKADMRKLMQAALDGDIPGKDISYAQRLTQSMLTIAANPKQGAAAVRAYETILRVVGQDVPDQSIVASDVTIEEMREYFKQKADS